MKTKEQQVKNELLARLNLLKVDTERIIAQPQYIKKENRIDAGIKAYTHQCVLCDFKYLEGCKGCVFGQNKSCLKSFWHPKKNATKKDFKIALEFLEFAIPLIAELPEFCFSEDYEDALREHIEDLDNAFEEDYNAPKKESKYKPSQHHKKIENSLT